MFSALYKELYLTNAEHHQVAPFKHNCSKHIAVVNNIYSWRKECLASQILHHEGAALCSAVNVLSSKATLDSAAVQRVLWVMCREWELVHRQLSTNVAASSSSNVRVFSRSLEDQMSGNER